MRITAELLRSLDACEHQVDLFEKFLGKRGYVLPTPKNILAAWQYGLDLGWAYKNNLVRIPPEIWVQWVIACVKRVLPIYEDGYPDDTRPRDAIEVARAWFDNPGEKTGQAALDASDAAAYASLEVASAASIVALAAHHVLGVVSSALHCSNPDLVIIYAVRSAAYCATVRKRERVWQADKLRELMGKQK